MTLMTMAATAHARISVMYAHEKASDIAAQQCFNEMYPKGKKVEIQESDEPCIIYCVFKKLGIMTASGNLNLDMYRKRIVFSQLDHRNNIRSDYGRSCVDTAESAQHKQDVCKKAKVFNDCTRLYRILLRL